VRLGQARGAVTRQDRSSQLHRDREAAPKLRTMFPVVEQLHVELSFEGGGAATPVPQSYVLHPPARAYFSFPCPYADCDGRFELTAAVQAAVQAPSLRTEGALECAGSRVSDFRSKPLCRLRVHFTIKVVCAPPH